MNNKIVANLGIGPMSTETVESVFRFSHYHRKQLMLIASKNQIDYSGGYVNNWTTAQYMGFINKMRLTYPNSDVKICRDHCGPGFNGNYDLSDSYKTIENDIENGFDLIHIDFCNFRGRIDEKLSESKKIIERCLDLNPNIYLEIGTDENFGASYSLASVKEISDEVDFFKSFCLPEFYVVQTGTIVKEINQAGSFNSDFVKKVGELLRKKNLKLKEHNADYLSKDDINNRKGIVDAMNIAPQLGAVQTSIILSKCLTYGIDFSDFIGEILEKGKWQKWMYKNTPENKMLCCLIAGHYHFASNHYKRIIEKLEKYEDIHESIVNSLTDIICHYLS